MLNILIFGPPGSGKGTQSLKIVDKYDLIHISTGDILRKEITDKTEIGLLAKKYIDRGNLVPDKVVLKIIYQKLLQEKDSKGFVFDGFPRTIYQAEILDRLLRIKMMPILLVISIEVQEQELFKRILGRAENSKRSDDNKQTISNRIDVYRKQTLPLIEYFKIQGNFFAINGMADIDTVFKRITDVIDNYLEK